MEQDLPFAAAVPLGRNDRVHAQLCSSGRSTCHRAPLKVSVGFMMSASLESCPVFFFLQTSLGPCWPLLAFFVVFVKSRFNSHITADRGFPVALSRATGAVRYQPASALWPRNFWVLWGAFGRFFIFRGLSPTKERAACIQVVRKLHVYLKCCSCWSGPLDLASPVAAAS